MKNLCRFLHQSVWFYIWPFFVRSVSEMKECGSITLYRFQAHFSIYRNTCWVCVETHLGLPAYSVINFDLMKNIGFTAQLLWLELKFKHHLSLSQKKEEILIDVFKTIYVFISIYLLFNYLFTNVLCKMLFISCFLCAKLKHWLMGHLLFFSFFFFFLLLEPHQYTKDEHYSPWM